MNTLDQDEYASLVPPTRKEMANIRERYLEVSNPLLCWYWGSCLMVIWRIQPRSGVWMEVDRINRIAAKLGMKVRAHSYSRFGRWRMAKVHVRELSQNEVRRIWG